MITAKNLVEFARENLQGRKFIVATQREPFQHNQTINGIRVDKAAGGVHALLHGVLKYTGGTIVALGSGSADAKVVDKKGHVMVPPGEDLYTLKRIFLQKKELEGFYFGFSNQTLWPICHAVFVKPIFDWSWWDTYVRVNEKYADAIIEELNGEPGLVWVNDYQLALLPRFLKQRNPDIKVGTFWHIPWPTHQIWRICPWRRELIEGLLGSDFIGFHRGFHVENFIDCARRDLELIVNIEPRGITHQGHRTVLANLPVGIDDEYISEVLSKDKAKKPIRDEYGIDYEYLAIGVDRIDYTKGLPERLRIIDRFLEKYPEFVEKFVYVSIGAPSRIHIPMYQIYNREVFDLSERINYKYSTENWQPIHFINRSIPRERIFSYMRSADVGIVTPLDDGMNLVAKEYVVSSLDDKGMLMLSKFTGAAKDLPSSLHINPYDIEDSAYTLHKALTMGKEERLKRNHEMKNHVKDYNIYQWGIDFLRNTLR